MALTEELDGIKEQLVELKDAVIDGDAEAIEQAEGLIAEAEKKEALIERSEKAAEIMAALTPKEEVHMEEVISKSIGEAAAKSFVGKAEKNTRFSVSAPEWKAVAGTILAPSVYSYDTNVAQGRYPLGIADLFNRQTISGNSYVFWRLSDKNGAFATVSEDGQKPQIDYAEDQVIIPLTKVAAVIKESDELLEDAEWMSSAINQRGIMHLNAIIEDQILNGTGTAPDMTGILYTSGIGGVTYANGGSMSIGDVLSAKTDVMTNSGLAADAVIINPADFDALITDSLSQQYSVDPWGFGDYRLWGMQVVQSSLITAGTCLVGAFREGATLVGKGGIRVEMTNSDDTDFQYNRVAIRIEERIALAVRIPGAFCVITEASS